MCYKWELLPFEVQNKRRVLRGRYLTSDVTSGEELKTPAVSVDQALGFPSRGLGLVT